MPIFSIFTFVTVIQVLIIVAVSIRVIMVRLPVSTSLAWPTLVFFLPLVGAFGYLVFGEKGLGPKFSARSRAIQGRYERWLRELPQQIRSDSQRLGSQGRPLSRLAATTGHIPALCGNRLQLLDETEPILSAIVSDIDHT
jgi:cardiolipin synthase